MVKIIWLILAAFTFSIFGDVFNVLWPMYVVGVILVLNLWLSVIFLVKETNYDGQMVVKEKESGGKLFSLELNSDPEELQGKNSILFKVVQSSE